MRHIRFAVLILGLCLIWTQGRVCWGEEEGKSDLDKILQKLSDSHKGVKTLILKGTYVQDLAYMPKGSTKKGTVEIWFEKPRSARVITKLGGYRSLSMSDGKTIWFFNSVPGVGPGGKPRSSVRKQDLKLIRADEGPDMDVIPSAARIGLDDFFFARLYAKESKWVEFKLEKEGKLRKEKVYVISASKREDLPKAGLEPTFRFWVGMKDGMIKKIEQVKLHGRGTTSLTYTEVKVNEPILESVLTFTPPPGMKIRTVPVG